MRGSCWWFLVAAVAAHGIATLSCTGAEAAPPNIVLILADDLGYRDLGCYGATKVKTPNIDQLAREGRLFSDAHSPAAVCHSTRYALMTGREWWRRPQGWYGNATLAEARVTLPGMLKTAGYATACIGKWHLGFGKARPDWNGELKPGPLEAGFDYFFGIPGPHGQAPQVFIENHRVVGLDPADPIQIEDRGLRASMLGGRKARFKTEELATVLTEKAVRFIEENRQRQFFLYFATTNIHGPLTPGARFKGTSQCGVYGDFIQELDWSVGEILGALDRLNLADRTLVLFTSDNGGVLRFAVPNGHFPNGELLGQKTDAWEGGHRVPLVARWPGHIKQGTRSAELISLSDMLATTAAILGKQLSREDAPDSFNMLPALVEDSPARGIRPYLTVEGVLGLAIREGRWLYLPFHDSGGLSSGPHPEVWMKFWELGRTNSDFTAEGKLKPDAPPGQLYDLTEDPGQTTNVYRRHPEVVKRMGERLETLEKEARGK